MGYDPPPPHRKSSLRCHVCVWQYVPVETRFEFDLQHLTIKSRNTSVAMVRILDGIPDHTECV